MKETLQSFHFEQNYILLI